MPPISLGALLLIASFLLPATLFAQGASAIPVALVDIHNARIVTQEGNKFTIAFELSNGEGFQSDVRYGVQLSRQNSDGQFVADEQVYAETLTLAERSNLTKAIVYEAPTHLKGGYTLYLVSKNKSGLPLSVANLGTITLSGDVSGLVILPDSCYLQVVEEKDDSKYTLNQGVDITSDETLRLRAYPSR